MRTKLTPRQRQARFRSVAAPLGMAMFTVMLFYTVFWALGVAPIK